MLLLSLVLTPAHALTADELLARVAEIEPLRSKRITDGVPTITEDMYRRAVEGEVPVELAVVEGQAAKKVYAVAVIDAPINRYWAAINDDVGKVERTRLSYVEVIAGTACEHPRTVFQYLTTPIIVSDRWWVADFDDNDPLAEASGGRVRELRWADKGDRTPTAGKPGEWAQSGVQVAFNTGAWLLVDLGGDKTLVEYYAWSDPGGSLPAGPVSSFAASGIDGLLTGMGDAARDGTNCPVGS